MNKRTVFEVIINMGTIESKAAAERRRKYQGTVKISIDQITPHPSCRKLDRENVERLCSIFRKESCRRTDIGNELTAMVSKLDLDRALEAAGLDINNLSRRDAPVYSELHFGIGQIQCLHGQHRLRAASKVLPPHDRWWLVDLYLDGMCGTGAHYTRILTRCRYQSNSTQCTCG
jgi:hypothetical protein